MTDETIPKADYEAIWEWCSRFAREALVDFGELVPFAANVSVQGELMPFAVDMQEKIPKANDVIELLIKAAKNEAKAERIRAFGICFDATVNVPGQKERSDAIVCRLEHSDYAPLEVILPYRLAEGRLECNKIHAGKAAPRVFLDDDLQ